MIPGVKAFLSPYRKGIMLVGFGLVIAEQSCFRINVSESLPQPYWVGLRGITPQKGSYVLVQKPRWGDSLLKQVTGVEGDLVSRQGSTLCINGQSVCTLPLSSGRDLKPLSDQVIPEGYVFVSTSHERGIDSRYENPGLIALESIKAVMWPLPLSERWTWGR